MEQKAVLLQTCHTVCKFLGHGPDLRGEDESPSPDRLIPSTIWDG